jgi:hypothetical protein
MTKRDVLAGIVLVVLFAAPNAIYWLASRI